MLVRVALALLGLYVVLPAVVFGAWGLVLLYKSRIARALQLGAHLQHQRELADRAVVEQLRRRMQAAQAAKVAPAPPQVLRGDFAAVNGRPFYVIVQCVDGDCAWCRRVEEETTGNGVTILHLRGEPLPVHVRELEVRAHNFRVAVAQS